MFGGFNMMFPDASRPFNNSYKCFSVSMLPGNERQDIEKGGKIIMPPSALDQLTRLNVDYPMLFKLTNAKKNRISHAGVLEFVADEGKVYIPYWMMHNLLLEEGDIIQLESTSLPVATYSKFQPQNPDFLDITNPKAVLENALRNFACLTSGDLIAIKYNSKIYELSVQEVKPGGAVSIIECDMNVEFAAPVGYQEPKRVQRRQVHAPIEDDVQAMDGVQAAAGAEHLQHEDPREAPFVAFAGAGNRLDGKEMKAAQKEATPAPRTYVRGIPNYDHPYGLIRFDRTIRKKPAGADEATAAGAAAAADGGPADDFQAFQGQGNSLKKGGKK